MQNLDLKRVLRGGDDEETNPVLNDRFEIRDLWKTTTTSKIYTGFDLVTESDVIIKFRHGKARDSFVGSYSFIDEDAVPQLLWEETLGPNHVLIYEKKGTDIEALFKKASNHFSLITTAMIFHLSICALEKIHTKKIVHTNLKPSKLLTDDNVNEHKIFLSGLEFCEKANRAPNKNQKPSDPKAKRQNENIYSSIAAHQVHSNMNFMNLNNLIVYSYRDDLEALGHIICNFFSDGKLFSKFNHEITEADRKALIKLKTNLRSDALFTTMPSKLPINKFLSDIGELSEYFKYVQKLKPEDMPDYEILKTLTFKLCQKLYVKNDIVSCLDWVIIPEEERSSYRAKMLSYFFCSNSTNSKKLKPSQIDDILFNQKKRPAHVNKMLLQTLQPDDFFRRNFQNMPILETQEEQNATKYYLDGFQLDLDEEYSSRPSTPRLATKDRAFISKDSQVEKFRSTITEEEKFSTKNESSAKRKTNSGTDSADSITSIEELNSPPRQVSDTPVKSQPGILMSLTLNCHDRPAMNKNKYEVYSNSKSLRNYHLSVPGTKPENSK